MKKAHLFRRSPSSSALATIALCGACSSDSGSTVAPQDIAAGIEAPGSELVPPEGQTGQADPEQGGSLGDPASGGATGSPETGGEPAGAEPVEGEPIAPPEPVEGEPIAAPEPVQLPAIDNPFSCEGGLDVGATPLVRMSSLHIQNSIESLFGIETDVQALSLSDERVGAFVSNFGSPVTGPVVEEYKLFAEGVGQAVAAKIGDLTACAAQDQACAVQFISEYAPLVYRRPLRDGEAERLLAVYTAGGDFTTGISLLVEGMLQSPFFLYRIETEGQEVAPGILELTDYELAARLSFALVGSTPDRELFDVAASGTLKTPDGLEAQVNRLLASDLASKTFADFHRDWLGVGQLDLVDKDPDLFPEYSEQLAAAMAEEVERFSIHVMQQDDARLETLLTASYSLIDAPLAEIYGVDENSTGTGQPVDLDPAERSGILTLPAVLTVNADREHSSPVLRGIWVRENLLCQTLPDPPDNVETSISGINTGMTTRERFEIHTQEPACAGCHALIDPIGHGFEHYDAIGRYRVEEEAAPVDASGRLDGLEGDVAADFDGAPQLGRLLLSTVDMPACVTTQWFQYSLGREGSQADSCSVQRAFSVFQDSDFNIKDLIRSIVTSDAFRHTKGLDQ